MRALIKDMVWVGLFAVAMTGCVAVPLAAVFFSVQLMDGNNSEAVPFVLVGASFLFFMSVGLAGVLKHRHRLRERGVPAFTEREEETELMQSLHHRSLELGRRLESLETLLLSRTNDREHLNL